MAVSEHGRGADQFSLRLPDGMRDRLRIAAEGNGRSMNAEIVDRLDASLGPVNPNTEIGPARERVERAMVELQTAWAEFTLLEMLV